MKHCQENRTGFLDRRRSSAILVVAADTNPQSPNCIRQWSFRHAEKQNNLLDIFKRRRCQWGHSDRLLKLDVSNLEANLNLGVQIANTRNCGQFTVIRSSMTVVNVVTWRVKNSISRNFSRSDCMIGRVGLQGMDTFCIIFVEFPKI